ncbi:UNKNOWN [Stylonychia lemnae]|uniref:Uncharacterized protein n=1 Tax=Stylonychia lemnae TaxID=5949 RepID=A0A078BD94_STYLE|nr:UNKNOWN [Stylonychia lemnae]|eukprot:CDW91558.1 UNKNOWN [Stylonychia lemnae]
MDPLLSDKQRHKRSHLTKVLTALLFGLSIAAIAILYFGYESQLKQANVLASFVEMAQPGEVILFEDPEFRNSQIPYLLILMKY